MENVSSSSNHTITASSFGLCPRLPGFEQWKKEYLTPVVFYNSVAAITINVLLLPVTTISNDLIMINILVDRQLRRNPFMTMLLSLSATDFLIGFLVQPIFIVARVSELFGRLDLVCNAARLQTLTGVACIGTSLCHTCLISVERYLAVRFPNRYKDILPNGRVIMIVLLIWLFMTTYAILTFAGLVTGYTLISRSVIVVMVIVVTAAFYIATFRETFTVFPRFNISPATASVNPGVPSLSRNEEAKYGPGRSDTNGCTSRNSSNNFSNAGQSLSSDGRKFLQSSTIGVRIDQISGIEKSDKTTNSPIADQFLANDGKFLQPSTDGVRVDQKYKKEDKSDNKVRQLGQLSAAALRRKMREKKLAKIMLITVGFLALCYFPEMIAYPLLTKNKEEMASSWIVLSWTNTLLHFNSFINPFWYSWRMSNLRKAVLKLVMRRFKKQNSNQPAQS